MNALEENLYRVSVGMVLMMACLFGFGVQIGVTSVTSGHVITAAVLLVVFSVSCRLRPVSRLLLCVSAGCCILAVAAAVGWSALADFFRGYLLWLMGEGTGLPAGSGFYPYLQTAALSFGCFLFQMLCEKLCWLERVIAGTACVGLLVLMFIDRAPGHLTVVFILLYAVIVYVRWTRQGWDKRKSSEARSFLAWILPFVALYLVAMAFMPAPEQPYGWPVVRRIYHNLQEAFVMISQTYFSGDGEDFELSRPGFSDGGGIAGGVSEEDKVIMTLSVKQRQSANIYLTGKVYDNFTGTQWRQTDSGIVDDRTFDTLETICAVQNYDRNNLSAYLAPASMEVTYQYYHTRYLFAPLKSWMIGGEKEKKNAYTQAGGNILFRDRKSYGTSYEVTYFQMNVGNKAFDQFLEGAAEPDEAGWQRAQRDYGRKEAEFVDFAERGKYYGQVREIYGSAPRLSDRVKEYLNGITEGADTDVEKLRAVESALLGYDYTRMPGALPDSISSEGDYLDYFLMESRRGFCSHFATAFVLLARAEGIPARYVEGFCVPAATEGETSVYSYMAHAWPEVYLENVGWVPFEPTPGYDRFRYTPWKTIYDREDRPAEFDRDEWLDWLESKEEQEENTQTEVEAETAAATGKRDSVVWKIAGYVVLVNLLFISFVLLCTALIRAKLRAKWSKDRRFLADVQSCLQIFSLMGWKRKASETLEEFDRRVGEEIELTGGEMRKLQFVRIYEEKLYGERTVGEGMLSAVKEDLRYLEGLLREREPRRYFYYRFVHMFL